MRKKNEKGLLIDKIIKTVAIDLPGGNRNLRIKFVSAIHLIILFMYYGYTFKSFKLGYDIYPKLIKT